MNIETSTEPILVENLDLGYRFEYDHWWYRARRKILSVFLSLIKARDQKSVLEIGCGAGGNLKYLFKDFKTVDGFEYNKKAAAFAQKNSEGKFKVFTGDANQLNIPDASYDCVALLDVLCHQNIKDVSQLINSIYKIVKPGGYLLITDGAFNFLAGQHAQSVDCFRRFTRPEIERNLNAAGFEVIKSSYWGLSLFFLLFIKRFIIEKLVFKINGNKNEVHDFTEPPVLKHILYSLVAYETIFLKHINFSFGASVCALAIKPER